MHTLAKIALPGAIASFGAGYALADTIVIAPEQKKVIREYVVREHVDPVPSVDYDITVGSVVPDTVEVRRLDVPDLGHDYEYVPTSKGTLIVDPDTRKIVDVID